MIGRSLSVLLVSLVFGGCDYSAVRDETSEFYAVPVGSILELNTEITIPPDQVSVLMQNGVIAKYGNIDYYKPNCKFELYTISENARVVRSDQFVVTKIVDENEYSGLQKLNVASRNMIATDAPETITYATVMYLHSETQSDVYRMTCKHWESIVDDRFLSISEMRKAMGDIFSLRINY